MIMTDEQRKAAEYLMNLIPEPKRPPTVEALVTIIADIYNKTLGEMECVQNGQ